VRRRCCGGCCGCCCGCCIGCCEVREDGRDIPGGSGEGPRWKCGIAPFGIGGEPCGVLCLTCCKPGWCCRPPCCCCCCIICWWWSGVPLASPVSSSPPSSSSSSSPPLSAKSCGPLCSCAAPYYAIVSDHLPMWDYCTRHSHIETWRSSPVCLPKSTRTASYCVQR
jgi:hypothetical protein